MATHPDPRVAAAAAIPTVLVTVSGGVADYQVESAVPVRVIVVDHDNPSCSSEVVTPPASAAVSIAGLLRNAAKEFRPHTTEGASEEERAFVADLLTAAETLERGDAS